MNTRNATAEARGTSINAGSAMDKKTYERANLLMKDYVKALEEKKAIQATIADDIKRLDAQMENAKNTLILLGEQYRASFDSDGNFMFEDGYLHVATNTVVETTKKFDATQFLSEFPDFIDIKLKTAPIKKHWLSKEGNKELKAAGVKVDTTEVMEVKPSIKKIL